MKSKMPEEEEVLLSDNLEQLLWEINEFCSPNNQKQDEIPPSLENYLKYVAKSGNTVFPWQHVRPLFRLKMLHAINNFSGEVCANEPFVLERFDLFRAAPFTIQRFSELITQPSRHYKLKEKFLQGLEKTVLVVTTIEPKSTDDSTVSEIEMTDETETADEELVKAPTPEPIIQLEKPEEVPQVQTEEGPMEGTTTTTTIVTATTEPIVEVEKPEEEEAGGTQQESISVEETTTETSITPSPVLIVEVEKPPEEEEEAPGDEEESIKASSPAPEPIIELEKVDVETPVDEQEEASVTESQTTLEEPVIITEITEMEKSDEAVSVAVTEAATTEAVTTAEEVEESVPVTTADPSIELITDDSLKEEDPTPPEPVKDAMFFNM